MADYPPGTTTAPDATKSRKSVSDLCEAWTLQSRRLRERKADGTAVTATDIKKLESQLAATKITDDQASAADNTQGPESESISFVISGVRILEDEVDHFKDSIAFAKEALNLIKLADLEDLDGARKCLDDLSDTNQALAEYQSRHHDGNLDCLQAVSFSRLTKDHVADMGVKTQSLVYPNFGKKIDEWFNNETLLFGPKTNRQPLSELFKTFWEELTSDGKFLRLYRTLRKSVAHKPEARARMLTDYIVLQVVDFLENYLHVIHLVFLELLLASTKKNPVVITHENCATLLTGSVDYAIWSSAITSQTIIQKLGRGDVSKLEEEIRALTNESSIPDIVDKLIWEDLSDLSCFKFSIIEEKRKDLKKKTLKDCEPQVIGEGLSILERKIQKAVSWCLSNGEEWLFGLLHQQDDLVNWSLPVLTIVDDDKLEDSIQAVFKMLVMWTVVADKTLQEWLAE